MFLLQRDNLIGHGVERIIRDRLMDQSDAFETHICKACGGLAEPPAPSVKEIVNLTHKHAYCRICKNNETTCKITVPYPMKLLMQELQAVHVGLSLSV
jgi:DNA-directed RNA polymerase beta subunit